MRVSDHEISINIEFNRKDAIAIAKLLMKALMVDGGESLEALETVGKRNPEAFALIEELLLGAGKAKLWNDFKGGLKRETEIQKVSTKGRVTV